MLSIQNQTFTKVQNGGRVQFTELEFSNNTGIVFIDPKVCIYYVLNLYNFI